jgi:predicted methyltransferase
MKNILVVLGLLVSGSIFAMDDNVAGSDNSSGCGYGWEVTKGKTLSASSTRGSTNSTASNTIAMTMGTSGCEKHDIVMQEKEQIHFANFNYEMIVADMAIGSGEYLNGFADVLGCSQASFASAAQQNLGSIMAANGAELLANIKTNSAIRQACL